MIADELLRESNSNHGALNADFSSYLPKKYGIMLLSHTLTREDEEFEYVIINEMLYTMFLLKYSTL